MGVIEYGDADGLSPDHARKLIAALGRLAVSNPRFLDWGPYSLACIAHPDLTAEIRALIVASEAPFGLRLLLLYGVKGSRTAPLLSDELRALMLDQVTAFAIRSAAADVLFELLAPAEWDPIARRLLELGDQSSIRLAIETTRDIGFEPYDDALIVDLVVAWAQRANRMVGVLYGFDERLPQERLDGILDRLSERASALGTRFERPGNDVLTDFAYELITRRVALGAPPADRLWAWLEPFDAHHGHHHETQKRLAALLGERVELRRALMRHVLLAQPGTAE
jgi:hypothetical protein